MKHLAPSTVTTHLLALSLATIGASFSACKSDKREYRIVGPDSAKLFISVQNRDAEGLARFPSSVEQLLLTELNTFGLRSQLGTLSADWSRKADFERRRFVATQLKPGELGILFSLRAAAGQQLGSRFRYWLGNQTTIINHQAEVLYDSRRTIPAFVRFAHSDVGDAILDTQDSLQRILRRALRGISQSSPIGDSAEKRSTPEPESEIVYYVMVDRFFDGDHTNNQNHQYGWHGGDIRGLIAKLDDIENLGITTLWLSPLYQSQIRKTGEVDAFHGYWVDNHHHIDPSFGTVADLRALRTELDHRGMKLWIDIVLNHVGYDSELPQKFPTWFHPKDGTTPETMWVHGLPDLNDQIPAVFDYLQESTQTWLDYAKPDGLRVDAVKHLSQGMIQKLRGGLRQNSSQTAEWIAEYFDGRPEHLAATIKAEGYDAAFDFPLYYAIKESVCLGAAIGNIAAAFAVDTEYPEASHLVTFVDNHDLPRIASVCTKPGAQDLAYAALFLSRGRPMLTWGSEFEARGIREPQNRPIHHFEHHPRRAALRELIELRRQYPMLQTWPSYVTRANQDGASFLRYGASEAFQVVLLRQSEETVPCDAELLYNSRLIRYSKIKSRCYVEGTGAALLRVSKAPNLQMQDIEFAGDSLTVAAGQYSALGFWDPAHSQKKFTAPSGVALRYKWAKRRSSGDFEFDAGADQILVVSPEDKTIVLTPSSDDVEIQQ